MATRCHACTKIRDARNGVEQRLEEVWDDVQVLQLRQTHVQACLQEKHITARVCVCDTTLTKTKRGYPATIDGRIQRSPFLSCLPHFAEQK